MTKNTKFSIKEWQDNCLNEGAKPIAQDDQKIALAQQLSKHMFKWIGKTAKVMKLEDGSPLDKLKLDLEKGKSPEQCTVWYGKGDDLPAYIFKWGDAGSGGLYLTVENIPEGKWSLGRVDEDSYRAYSHKLKAELVKWIKSNIVPKYSMENSQTL
tara:strand:- start:39923 stop:40387 length:465 start_codon:yes stop_codon:yes gene_type:complete